MYITHKNNTLQNFADLEWQCRENIKGFSTNEEYHAWVESVTGDDGVPDFSGETGYTIVECYDENIHERLIQLDDYISHHPKGTIYNIKYYAAKRDAEEIKNLDGNSFDPKQYVQSHFVGQDDTRDARLLAEEWEYIRAERDRLLTNSDWTQSSDTALASAKVTEWATYRTKLRTLPADQSSETTYADITWPPQPS